MDPSGPYAQYYLAGFCVSTVAAISIMGGTFAVLPAYEAGNTTELSKIPILRSLKSGLC
jgi:hypothetical protein